jgi:hypothetical protein
MKEEAVSTPFALLRLGERIVKGRGRDMKEGQSKESEGKCQHRSVPIPSLRELRRSRGLTQRDLARLADVSSGTVFRLENML